MNSQSSRARLDPEQAFVVHLTATAAMRGRVEHVTSGQSLRFASVSELIAFMQRALAEGRPE